jgi:catechol 2,3-dioxygenase-like lactoylglutathione lyase family enzyme
MPVSALDHFTIRCSEADLEPLCDFYTRHIGLRIGNRPPIPAPGFWLYSEGRPIVHLYAIGNAVDAAHGTAVTGPLDHISFRAHGLAATRAHLRANGIAFEEAPVPGWPLHQVFVRDPKGLKIELTFDLDAEREQRGG